MVILGMVAVKLSFNHINYFYVPFIFSQHVANYPRDPDVGKPMTWNDGPMPLLEDGTPVAVPTGAINFGEPGTNGQGDPDDFGGILCPNIG